MDRKQYAAYMKKYQTQLLPRFEIYAKTLDAVLREAARRYMPLAIVQVRPKGVSSFAEKIVRKGYKSPFVQMTDLCGGRVITVTEQEVEVMSAFIKENFVVDYANSLDVRDRLGTSEFGYRSVHYVVQFRPGHCLGVKIPKAVLPTKHIPFKAEIQVRTTLQHAWASVLHDRTYKNNIDVPEELTRDSARLAALLEEADGVVSRVVEHIDAFAVDIGAYMPKPRIIEELENLELVLTNEKNKEARESLALRMAKMLRAVSDWTGAERLMQPFVKTTANAGLLREYGHAVCQANAASPDGAAYGRGQSALARALELDPRQPDTHAMLARSYQRQSREEARARVHLRTAYHLAPENPYHLAAYVEYELLRAPSSALIPTLEPTIRAAIATCGRHLEVGIEMPQAHLTMGKLHLLLGDAYSSLDAYAKGLRMVLSPSSGICPACLERELDALARLANAQEELPGDAWVRESLIEGLRRMLLLGLYLTAKDKKRLKALRELRLAELAPAGRVLIVAGACTKRLEAEMKAYRPLLEKALADFGGTIIGGGTTSGISGVVGSLGLARNRRYNTLGYYPAHMAPDVTPDTRYDVLIKTAARGFCPLDAVQAWVDIVSAGIAPERVSVLGINGGDIAGFEYRLGLALGASTGVIAGTGRAADALLEDRAWAKLANPLGLINDPMTVRAFANPGESDLPAEKLEALAAAIHTVYCKADPATLNPRILKESGQPWGLLTPTYKNANRAQAVHLGGILKTEGYALVPSSKGKTDDRGVTFTAAEVERMAEKEHGRWNVERLREGWEPGKRDDTRMLHDCLVPWAGLPDKIKEDDRNAVRSWPHLLKSVGIAVRKDKKRG